MDRVGKISSLQSIFIYGTKKMENERVLHFLYLFFDVIRREKRQFEREEIIEYL